MNGTDETTGTGRLAARFCGFKPLALRTVSIDAGAERPFRAVCVADTHLVRADTTDNDPRKVELAARRYPEMGFGERYLTEAVMRARNEKALLLHLGDIYDFVSSANLKLAGLAFGADDWFACVGNHEFSRYVGEAEPSARPSSATVPASTLRSRSDSG